MRDIQFLFEKKRKKRKKGLFPTTIERKKEKKQNIL